MADHVLVRADQSNASMNMTVDELAAKPSGKRGLNAPFMVVMITFIVVVLAGAVIPTCVIVFSNSSSIISDLALEITKTVGDKLGMQLEAQLNNIAEATIIWMNSAQITSMMTNVTNGLGFQREANLFSFNVLSNTPGMGELVCHQASNLTGKIPPNNNGRSYANTTLYGIWLPNNTRVLDYTTDENIYEGEYDTVTGLSTFPTKKAEGFTPEVIATYGGIFRIMKTGCVPFWKAEIVGVPRISFATCAPFNQQYGRVPFACGSSLIVSTTFVQTFAALSPTANSRLFMVTGDSRIVGCNRPEVQFLNAAGSDFRPVLNVSDSVILGVSRAILAKFSSWDAIPLKTELLTHFDTFVMLVDGIEGDQWITRIRSMHFEHSNDTFYLVVALPRRDYFDSADKSLRTGIIISAVIGVLGCALGIVLVIATVHPMKIMTQTMKQVTRFDFSTLESGLMAKKSFFTELRDLEETFSTMVVAFANGIRQNRDLSARKGGNAFSNSTPMSMPSTVQLASGARHIAMP